VARKREVGVIRKKQKSGIAGDFVLRDRLRGSAFPKFIRRLRMTNF
jgi:hypothetical protein